MILYFYFMIITDTHTHLYSEAFSEDQDEMIQRALDANVKRFFIPAIDSTYTKSMLDLQKKYPEHVYLMMGLHPTHVKENYLDELAHVEEMLETHKFYAVGEIGIDLYWDKTTLEIQQKAFKHQIKLAKKYKLPIVIHCRDAFDEVFEVLESEKGDDLFQLGQALVGDQPLEVQRLLSSEIIRFLEFLEVEKQLENSVHSQEGEIRLHVVDRVAADRLINIQ